MSHPAFAVIVTAPIFCPDTDGAMGEGKCVVGRFLTKREADEACAKWNVNGEEASYHVELRPYRDGEEKMPRPRWSLIELANDAWAQQQTEIDAQHGV